MSQNIYDTPEFFTAYSQLPRSIAGLEGAPEWSSIRAVLPPLAGRRVADLGCGYGWFCRWAAAAGAASVLGVDISERMLARAGELTADPAIVYRRMDLEQPDLGDAAFDLVYSSLALHYVERLGALLAAIFRALVPGGSLVVSVEHPIFTAPRKPGWVDGAWPVDQYQVEGPRVTDWLAPGVVKQHRTLATLLMLLLDAGFTLRHVEEWSPTDAQIAERPALAAERDRPTFLIYVAARAP